MNTFIQPTIPSNVIQVSFFCKRPPKSNGAVTIGQAIPLLIAHKTAMNKRPKYVTGLGQYLRKFAQGREDMPIADFRAEDIEQWFARFEKLAPSTKVADLGRLSSLFNFARRKKWVEENICDDIERPFIERGVPSILTLEQCRCLMQRVRTFEPSLISYFALALFMGIRPEEILKLNQSNIQMERGFVEISSAVSKTRHRRYVTINPTARAWLEYNSTLSKTNFRRKFRRVRFDLVRKKWIPAIPWSHDVLRHTAASMLFEKHGAVHTSKELGHSERMLFAHYRNLVRPDEVEEFWDILPENTAGIPLNLPEKILPECVHHGFSYRNYQVT